MENAVLYLVANSDIVSGLNQQQTLVFIVVQMSTLPQPHQTS